MGAPDVRPQSWGTRPFPDVVEELWAKQEGRRRARYTTLLARIDGPGYEAFRLMCVGRARPQPHVMEQVAAVLGIDPRQFPEYRLHQVLEAFRRHPDLLKTYYDEIMAYAAQIEKSEARRANRAK